MNLVTSYYEDVPCFEVLGEIDHNNMEEFAHAVDSALADGAGIILVDLENVTYIDSGGLSVLYRLVQGFCSDEWVGVIGPSANVLKMLDIIGLTEQKGFRVFDSRESAVRGLETANR